MIQLTKFHKTLLCIPPVTIILSNSIYKSWDRLDSYELEKENYKNLGRKIEEATSGFIEGTINGIMYTAMSPLFFGGSVVAAVHTLYNKKK